MSELLQQAMWICMNYQDVDSNGNPDDWMRVAMLIEKALQAEGHVTIPEDCVPVPVEPTEAMIDAALAVVFAASVHGKGGWNNYLTALYKAMLSARKGEQQ
jgi:hypothetical protein